MYKRQALLWATFSGLGAFFGVFVLVWRRSVYAFPLAAFPVIFPFLYYITHTSLRYRHPIDPVVLLLAAIAAGGLFQIVLQKRPSKEPNAAPDAGAV